MHAYIFTAWKDFNVLKSTNDNNLKIVYAVGMDIHVDLTEILLGLRVLCENTWTKSNLGRKGFVLTYNKK